MNIMRWNPFRELDQVFDRYAVPGVFSEDLREWQPLVDIRETENAYRIEVELPAIDPEDVSIDLKGGVLHVSGERDYVKEDDTGRVHHSERRYGKFTRSFRLPEDADPEAIDAAAKDGVITITVGKSAKALGRSIKVKAA